MTRTPMILLVAAAALAGGLVARAPLPEAIASRPAAEIPVGRLDIYLVMQAQMSTEDFISERVELTEQYNARLDPLIDQIESRGDLLRLLDPSDPSSRERAEEYEMLRTQYNQLTAEAQTGVQTLYIQQLLNAYQMGADAANQIADEAGIEVLMASRAPGSKFDSTDNINIVLQDLLSRPILSSPAGTDITDQVLERLGLERPEDTGAPLGAEQPAPEGP